MATKRKNIQTIGSKNQFFYRTLHSDLNNRLYGYLKLHGKLYVIISPI